MAKLYIAEFSGSGAGAGGGSTGFAILPPVAEQALAIGAVSVPSAAFNAATDRVRISTDVVCSIAFGANPVATVGNMRLAANESLDLGVRPGQKIAVITNT